MLVGCFIKTILMAAQHFIAYSNYSLMFGRFGCFLSSTIINNASTNISVHEMLIEFRIEDWFL